MLTQGDYTYTTNDKGQATITGFNKDFKGELAILDTLGGCPVSGISSRAFATTPGITRIKIPASVASIGDAWGMAFANLPNLTAIEVDAANPNYSSAGGVLFNKDKTTLLFRPVAKTGPCAISASVTKIELGALPERKGIHEFAVDEVNKTYSSRDGVLFNKEKTTLIQCPVSKSGTYSIPAGVTDITDGAFLGCTGLTEIMIPSSVSRIGNSAFYQCDGLAAIQVDEANQTYSSLEGGLLSKDQTTLLLCPSARKGDYAIPAKVASINLHAFTSCTDLTRVTIPESVTSISHSSFHNCAGLMAIEVAATNKTYSSLNGVWFNKERTILIRCPRGLIGDYEIPPGVSTIGRYAFSGCSGLTQLGIPESVTAIEYQAFQGCEKLATSIKGLGRINFNASSSYAGMPSAPEPSVPATSTSPGAPPPPPPPRRQIRR